jgi:hypothetical protein
MVVQGSFHPLFQISRKIHFVFKRNPSSDEEMEILPCKFMGMSFLLLVSTG